MNNDLYLEVKEIFDKWHSSGHDFRHVEAVSKYAREIAKSEGYDVKEAEVTGLLHDMGRTDPKGHDNHAKASIPIAKKLLDQYVDFSSDAKSRILDAIEHHSDKFTTGKLANILQDADKLDGMGAIGVLRASAFKNSLPIFNEEALDLTIETASDDPKTLYEQMLYTIRWKNMFYTDYAKNLVQKRYELMVEFVENLKREVEEGK